MKKIITLFAAAFAFASVATAQESASNFFLENYSYAYRYNPARMADRSFFALGIGNIGMKFNNSLGADAFMYEKNGQLVSAFNKQVTSEEFLSHLKDENTLGLNYDMNLLALGIRRRNSMFTIESNILMGAQINLPKDMFAFLKNGSSDTPYDLSGLGLGTSIMSEVVIGYSRMCLYDKLNVGMRIHGIAGGTRVDLRATNASIVSTEDQLAVNLEYQAVGASPVDIATNADGTINYNSPVASGTSFNPAGLGIGIDLGATYKAARNLEVSAAVTNLGKIVWNNTIEGNGSGKIDFTGFNDVDLNNTEEGIDKEVDKIKDNIEDFKEIKTTPTSSKFAESLPYNVNAGVRYTIPFVKFITVGATAAYHNRSYGSWYEARAGLSLTPLKWFSIAGNIGTSTYGPVYGMNFSITALCFDIYANFESNFNSYGTYNLQGVKVKYPIGGCNFAAQFGINMQIGKRK